MIAVFSQVKKGQDAPIYVINLLVSNLFQLCCRIPLDLVIYNEVRVICLQMIYFGVLVSVGFMVCISCERYLVVAKPLWYRFRRNIKTYVVVCIVVWILPLLYYLIIFLISVNAAVIFCIVFLLLPFPLFIFFLVGTIKALSGALNVPADEKRRITAIQVVVLIIYTLLYLPIIIWLLCEIGVLDGEFYFISSTVAFVCGGFSPLADATLYLLSRKSILDKFLALICSCKISNNQETSSTDHESSTVTTTEPV
ncbi:G-protein coupled receptor 4-like [Poecilia reticulata]|uniref:G-protein coupled receptor 4-like n=1 Tax=Poecilia reticulata TaxID=8081 RepID=UPI0007EB2EFD|nr:PREDICTED: G-protein coupled receptor 4-like [Poecilia reticulata]